MDLLKLFTQAGNVLKLKKGSIRRVEGAPIREGLVLVGFMAILSSVGYVIFPESPVEGVIYRPDLLWVVQKSLATFFLYIFSFGFIGFLAEKLFDAKHGAEEFLSVMGYASLAGFLLLVPDLLPAVVLWWWFVAYDFFTKEGKLSRVTVLLLFVIQALLLWALSGL